MLGWKWKRLIFLLLIQEGFRFRLRTDADVPALRKLYVEMRWRERERFPAPLDDDVWRALLAMQFELQHKQYAARYPDADFAVLELYEELLGRLYLNRTETEWRIIDIGLAPAYRNRGIGRAVLEGVLKQAGEKGCEVWLQVDPENRARKLYSRLGFVIMTESDTSSLMRWSTGG